MEKKFIKIIGSWTEVLSLGNYAESDECILVFPGNPGIIGFYEPFMTYIHHLMKLPVIGISHGGHLSGEDYSGECSYLDLPQQIRHKVEFVKEHLPNMKKIYLIGHSIGCYVILRVLEDKYVSNHLKKAIFLFPAIEHLSKTPHGQFWTPLAFYCRYPLAITGYFASFLPTSFKNYLISWRTKWRDLPENLLSVGQSCFGYSILNHALYMAASEMNILSDLDETMIQVIHEHEKRLVFYYGKADGWVPHEFYENMKERFPNVDIRLCKHGFKHDFVLDSVKDISHICKEIFEN